VAGKFRTFACALLTLWVALSGVGSIAVERDIYPAAGRATTELAVALAAASSGHKRVILDFGGNWCTDCHVLDRYFHDSTNGPLLHADFILVYINVGRLNENLDIAERYHIPLRKGVPALAVLGENGELLYSQSTGEFQPMRALQSSAVTEFLLHWRHPA
jgi:thiol:disulfide interchange protein